jgi:hypothetical protein
MWQGVWLIICAIFAAIKPSLAQIWREPFHWNLNAVLSICAVVLLVAAVVQFTRALRVRSSNEAKAHAPSDRDPQPGIVALDELKELLREGEAMFARYYVGQEPTRDQVEDYRSRTRACARQKALAPTVSIKDLARFEESFEQDREIAYRLLQKKAELLDTGFVNFDSETFDLLYERFERLKQLIATIESKEENQSWAS